MNNYFDENEKQQKKRFRIIVLMIGISVFVMVGILYNLGIIDSDDVVSESEAEPFIRIAPEGTIFETFTDQAHYQGFTENDRISENCYQTEKRKFCQNEDGTIELIITYSGR